MFTQHQIIITKREHFRWQVRQSELTKLFNKKRDHTIVQQQQHNIDITNTIKSLQKLLQSQTELPELLCLLNEVLNYENKPSIINQLQEIYDDLMIAFYSDIDVHILRRIIKLMNCLICYDDSMYLQIQKEDNGIKILQRLESLIIPTQTSDLVVISIHFLRNLLLDTKELVGSYLIADDNNLLVNLTQYIENCTDNSVHMVAISLCYQLVQYARNSNIHNINQLAMYFYSCVTSQQVKLDVQLHYEQSFSAYYMFQMAAESNYHIYQNIRFPLFYSECTMFIITENTDPNANLAKYYYGKIILSLCRHFISSPHDLGNFIMLGMMEVIGYMIQSNCTHLSTLGIKILIAITYIDNVYIILNTALNEQINLNNDSFIICNLIVQQLFRSSDKLVSYTIRLLDQLFIIGQIQIILRLDKYGLLTNICQVLKSDVNNDIKVQLLEFLSKLVMIPSDDEQIQIILKLFQINQLMDVFKSLGDCKHEELSIISNAIMAITYL